MFYTHHRPHLAHKDLEFFTAARAGGWKCEEVVTEWTGVSAAICNALGIGTSVLTLECWDAGDVGYVRWGTQRRGVAGSSARLACVARRGRTRIRTDIVEASI